MESKYFLLTTWKYKYYQLNILFKNRFSFSTKESALLFGKKLEELHYRLSDQIYPDPKKMFYTGIPLSEEEFNSGFPRLILINQGTEFEINSRQKYCNLSLYKKISFDSSEITSIPIKDFFHSLDQDVCFEKNSIEALEKYNQLKNTNAYANNNINAEIIDSSQ